MFSTLRPASSNPVPDAAHVLEQTPGTSRRATANLSSAGHTADVIEALGSAGKVSEIGAALEGSSSATLPPPMPPAVRLDAELAQGMESFAQRISEVSEVVFDKLLEGTLSSEHLLALFLKLNITDPNNSVETHNALHQVTSELRQTALVQAKKEAEAAHQRAIEALKKADGLAKVAKALQGTAISVAVLGVLLTVAVIVVAIVVTVLSAGAAAPVAVGATAAVAGGTAGATAGTTAGASSASAAGTTAAATAANTAVQAAIKTVVNLTSQMLGQAAAKIVQAILNTIVNLVVQAAQAIANNATTALAAIGIASAMVTLGLNIGRSATEYEVQQQQLNAQQAENTAQKARRYAEKLQDLVEDQAEIIKVIMEARNEAISAAIRMAQAAAATQLKVMAAGVSRG